MRKEAYMVQRRNAVEKGSLGSRREATIPNFFPNQELASVTYEPLILVPVFHKIIMLKMYLCMKLMNKPTIHIFRTVY